MSDSVADDQIKAFVDRILRMKEEAREINRDIREIYAEAKGQGFDKTVLGKVVNYVEKRANDASALQESEALFDLYLSAYLGTGTRVATHTHEIPSFVAMTSSGDEYRYDAETGEITEPQPQPAAQSQGFVEVARSHSPDRREGDDDGQPIQPETAHEIHESPSNRDVSADGEASPLAGPQAEASLTAREQETGTLAGHEGHSEGEAGSLGLPTNSTIYTFTPKPHDGPISNNRQPRMRGCLNLDACAGSWNKRCYGCERAWTANQSTPESAA